MPLAVTRKLLESLGECVCLGVQGSVVQLVGYCPGNSAPLVRCRAFNQPMRGRVPREGGRRVYVLTRELTGRSDLPPNSASREAHRID